MDVTEPRADPGSVPGTVGVASAGRELGASARLVGALTWWERRCFELTGAWAGDCAADAAEPELAVHLASVSRHHAWRADTLESRLPRLRELPVGEVLVPPGAGAVRAADVAAATVGGVGRLAVLQRVLLARLAAAYGDLLASSSPVADAALTRWVAKVLDDTTADWLAGERILQARLVGPGAVEAAAGAVAQVEALLADHPGSLPPA
jgi:hypothetical protein